MKSRVLLTALAAGLLAIAVRLPGQTYTISPLPQVQYIDANGNPLASGKVYTYTAGTTTPLNSYSDNAGTPNTNPVILNSSGRATIYLISTSCYKIVVKTSADVTVFTQDNVCPVPLLSISGAIVGTSDSQTLSNKTLNNTNTITVKDSLFTIQDEGNTSRQVVFQLSGLSAATRTITMPDASLTLTGTSTTDTLSNKTIASPTITGTSAVSSADGETIGGIITPQHLEVVWHGQFAASPATFIDQSFFIANRAYQVTNVTYVQSTAETTANPCNVQVVKDTGTDAPGAGTDLLTNNANAGFDARATANTVQTGTLTGTVASLQLASGNRLSVDWACTGTITQTAGVTITVTLKRI
jgi:hypothetical protein